MSVVQMADSSSALLSYRFRSHMSFKCALCAEHHSHNVYYCSSHDWYLCWNCVKKATFTNKLSCPKCGHEVSRVD